MRRLLSAVVSSWFALVACSGPGPRQPIAGPSVDEVLERRPRLLWVAAHPDDESMAGGLLAHACVGLKAPCHFLVFNRGAGGECFLEDGCKPNLASVRQRELGRAARLYLATLEHYEFFNAPLPVESFPSRPELERKWLSEGDPVGLVARAVRRFKPDVVVTLDPYQGFTGHPEHKAAAHFALAGIAQAADPKAKSPYVTGEPPHRVTHVYHVQNKYWFMALAGDPNDPKPYNEAFDSEQPCDITPEGDARSCRDVRDANTRAHRSQDGDMNAIRSASKYWGTLYLRRLDPFGPEAAALVAEIGKSGR
jgi:LmbE family N-acetylglucosaminyl deacetylase